jgi:hypothetical protein
MIKWSTIILLIIFKYYSYSQDSTVIVAVMRLSNGTFNCVGDTIRLRPLKVMITCLPKPYSGSFISCEGRFCDSINSNTLDYAKIWSTSSKSRWSLSTDGRFKDDSLHNRDTLTIESDLYFRKKIPIQDVVEKGKLIW